MSAVHLLEVSQDILDSARLTPADLQVEMAVHLYAQGRLSAGKEGIFCSLCSVLCALIGL